jgi:hypothetical protein
MDSRLIFLHCQSSIKTDGGTRPTSRPDNGLTGMVEGDPDWQIRRVVRQENPLRRIRQPYHKPTQVDEMNILRRSGDGMFRN